MMAVLNVQAIFSSHTRCRICSSIGSTKSRVKRRRQKCSEDRCELPPYRRSEGTSPPHPRGGSLKGNSRNSVRGTAPSNENSPPPLQRTSSLLVRNKHEPPNETSPSLLQRASSLLVRTKHVSLQEHSRPALHRTNSLVRTRHVPIQETSPPPLQRTSSLLVRTRHVPLQGAPPPPDPAAPPSSLQPRDTRRSFRSR